MCLTAAVSELLFIFSSQISRGLKFLSFFISTTAHASRIKTLSDICHGTPLGFRESVAYCNEMLIYLVNNALARDLRYSLLVEVF